MPRWVNISIIRNWRKEKNIVYKDIYIYIIIDVITLFLLFYIVRYPTSMNQPYEPDLVGGTCTLALDHSASGTKNWLTYQLTYLLWVHRLPWSSLYLGFSISHFAAISLPCLWGRLQPRLHLFFLPPYTLTACSVLLAQMRADLLTKLLFYGCTH